MDSLPIGNYAVLSADTVYTESGWQLELTIENISDAQQTFDMRFADTTTAGLLPDGQKIPSVTLAAGERRKLYFPVKTLPGAEADLRAGRCVRQHGRHRRRV